MPNRPHKLHLHGVIWSLSLNILTYIVMSLAQRPSSIERLQADLFVPAKLAPVEDVL